jgi:hypothetical protein
VASSTTPTSATHSDVRLQAHGLVSISEGASISRHGHPVPTILPLLGARRSPVSPPLKLGLRVCVPVPVPAFNEDGGGDRIRKNPHTRSRPTARPASVQSSAATDPLCCEQVTHERGG